jgi:hypothetical protein
MSKRQIVVALVGFCALVGVSCADDSDDSDDSDRSKNDASADTKPSQSPPQGASAIEAWLKKGDYKDWQCESGVHEARSPSPHGFNRICSNDAISSKTSGSDAWPSGAAAVKELYASADDDKPAGYAVYLKTKSDSANGANWYWYERVPLDSAAPHDDDGVVADGLGSAGPAKAICVGCHVAAGSDDAHTPSSGGRDQVYTPVP